MENLNQIKTYEDALIVLGREDFSHENLYPREIARRKLEIIIETLNEGWKPDWKNYRQTKWYPHFYGLIEGLGYSHTSYSPSPVHAHFGVRLCCKDEKTADYVGQQFFNLYKEMLLG